MKKAKRKNRRFWLLCIVLAIVIIAALKTSVRQAVDEPELDSFYAHIRAVDGGEGGPLIVTDYVEYLKGEAAIAAGLVDTACSRETITVCVPTIEKGYYVRNLGQETTALRLTSGTSILLSHPAGPGSLATVAPAEFFSMYDDPAFSLRTKLFKISHRASEVATIEETDLSR